MTTIKYRVTNPLHELVRKDLDRLMDTRRVREELGDVLSRQFAQAQSLVHTHPPGGSFLKASGRMTEEWDSFTKTWTGTLSWGEGDDPTAGPRTLGAVWGELDRGGEHSAWVDTLYEAEPEYRAALERHFRGGPR